uniref:DNA polymerase III subunit psi n=1 Tax=Pedobacter schmidteae TaxID=2201271 RepID=UPI000EB2D46C|nr:DNA polymerase III subunit psi [Pedobacter schmidteae]
MNENQLTTSGAALNFFFTDDVYLVKESGFQLDEPAPVSKSEPAVKVKENVVASPDEAVEFKFLGNNKRNILILVNDEQHEVSDEMGRELLRKIVKSVNLSANDFALLNYARYKQADFNQLQSYFSSSLIFAFGVTPAQLALGGHPEHTIVQQGAVRMIFSAELRTLDQNPAGKKALWACLQNLGL